jgi:hypothetical protein
MNIECRAVAAGEKSHTKTWDEFASLSRGNSFVIRFFFNSTNPANLFHSILFYPVYFILIFFPSFCCRRIWAVSFERPASLCCGAQWMVEASIKQGQAVTIPNIVFRRPGYVSAEHFTPAEL